MKNSIISISLPKPLIEICRKKSKERGATLSGLIRRSIEKELGIEEGDYAEQKT